MRRVDKKDLIGGAAVSALGLFLLWHALGYQLGSASRMGPGYFPALLGGITAVLGLLMVGLSFLRGGAAPNVAWRPLIAVLAGIVCFILSLRTLGLLPAIALTVCVSSLGDRQARPVGIALLALGCALGAWLIFRVGLGMPLAMIRLPF